MPLGDRHHEDSCHTERDEQFAFKAPRNVRHCEQGGIEEGEQGLPAQVSAGLCPNHFHPAEFDGLILQTLLKRFAALAYRCPALAPGCCATRMSTSRSSP